MAAKVFVITGPSGVGKGTLIKRAARARPRPRALDLGDHPGSRARARWTGATTTSSRREEFDQRMRRGRLPRVRHLQRQPLRDAALGGRAAARRRALGRARDRGPGRAAGAGGDARVDPDLHRAARPGGPARAPRRPRHRLRRGDRRAARGRRAGAGRPGRLRPPASSTTISSRAAGELEGIVRAELGPDHLDSPAE